MVFCEAATGVSLPTNAPMVVKLASVCKYWRGILLSFPDLWNTMLVYIDQPLHLDFLSTILLRSSTSTLYVFVKRKDGYPQLPESAAFEETSRLLSLLFVLQPHMRRVYCLRIEVCGGLPIAHALKYYTGTADSLQELTLLCYEPIRSWWEEDGEQRRRRVGYTTWDQPVLLVPHLNKLTINGALPLQPQTLAHFTTIRELTLTLSMEDNPFDPSQMMKMLVPLKHLTHFRLDGSLNTTEPALLRIAFPNDTADLLSLRSLRVDSAPRAFLAFILSHIRAPLLETLDITGLRGDYTIASITSNAFRFLNTSGTTPLLDTLRLSMFDCKALDAILPHLSFCKRLILHDAISLQDTHLLALGASRLSPTLPSRLCPKLISLELMNAPFVTTRALRSIVQARKSHSLHADIAKADPIAVLESLRILCNTRLGVEDRAWFVENVPTFYWGHDDELRTASLKI